MAKKGWRVRTGPIRNPGMRSRLFRRFRERQSTGNTRENPRQTALPRRSTGSLRMAGTPNKKGPPHGAGLFSIRSDPASRFDLHGLHLLFGNAEFFSVVVPVGHGRLHKKTFRQRHGSLERSIGALGDGACKPPDLSDGKKPKRRVQDRLSAANLENGAKGIVILSAEQAHHLHAISFCCGSRKPRLMSMDTASLAHSSG